MAERTCGGCKHWRLKGLNPQDLAAGKQGECREQLHTVGVPQQGPAGFRLGIMAVYPEVPESFPACDRFQEQTTVLLESKS